MNAPLEAAVIRQHLIDPEICIRCNTCEATCPVDAITHDDRNYVVDADKCNQCMACISPCPTGSIDNWRVVPRAFAYSPAEQLTWDVLPAELSAEQLAAQGVAVDAEVPAEPTVPNLQAAVNDESVFNAGSFGATLPPWSVSFWDSRAPECAPALSSTPPRKPASVSDFRSPALRPPESPASAGS